jgi:hypothetical protein
MIVSGGVNSWEYRVVNQDDAGCYSRKVICPGIYNADHGRKGQVPQEQ